MPHEGKFVIRGFEKNKPLKESTIRRFWTWIRKNAKLVDGRLHDFRHTSGTYAAQAGFNTFAVRDLLGHKMLAMTGYVGKASDAMRHTADVVSNRVAAAMGHLDW